jgi:multidrug resistance protein
MRRGARAPLPAGFATIWTTVALDLVGFGIVLPILPLYARELDASPTAIGALVASFSLMQLVFSPLWGRVSDRWGRKPVLVVSLVGTAIGSLLTGLAGSLWLLFAGRIIDGISGASVSVAQAAVTDLAPPAQRARLLGLLGAAFGVGFVVGPALGSLAAVGGRQLPFLLAAAVAAGNAVVALRRLPETHPDPAVGGRRAAHGPGPGPTPTGATGAGTDVAGEPLPVDGTADALQPPVSSGLLRFAVVAFTSLVAFSAFEATFSLLGQERFDLTLGSTGALFAAIGVVLVVVQAGLIHPVVSRLGEVPTLRLGLALDVVGLGLLAVSTSWPPLVAALLLLVVGQGLVTPTLSSIVAGRARADRRGRALGFQQSAGGLARVVGPAVGGAAFEHVGVAAPSVLGAALAAVAVLLTLPDERGPSPAGDHEVVGVELDAAGGHQRGRVLAEDR